MIMKKIVLNIRLIYTEYYISIVTVILYYLKKNLEFFSTIKR